ncbi:MAG TPA: ABC transporter substrate-binding protein [Gammaproteobacteria bacterium]|nr:ABC transporter substrate-binding protein [Gammaproteobacteria bacterium]
MKRVFLPLLLGLVLNSAVTVAGDLDPESLVRQTSDRMLVVLKEQHDLIQAEPERLYGLVDDIVLPHFDFERMARWVLGKHWKRASPDQQQRFVNDFRTLLVRTYGTALLEYRDQQIKFLPLRMAAGSEDVTVRTEVVKPGGVPIPISYSMFRRADGWKVYDVAIDGISLVSNYRSSFSTEIKDQGMDKLIQRLVERNAKGDNS